MLIGVRSSGTTSEEQVEGHAEGRTDQRRGQGVPLRQMQWVSYLFLSNLPTSL